jgi:hypothetical protein
VRVRRRPISGTPRGLKLVRANQRITYLCRFYGSHRKVQPLSALSGWPVMVRGEGSSAALAQGARWGQRQAHRHRHVRPPPLGVAGPLRKVGKIRFAHKVLTQQERAPQHFRGLANVLELRLVIHIAICTNTHKRICDSVQIKSSNSCVQSRCQCRMRVARGGGSNLGAGPCGSTAGWWPPGSALSGELFCFFFGIQVTATWAATNGQLGADPSTKLSVTPAPRRPGRIHSLSFFSATTNTASS